MRNCLWNKGLVIGILVLLTVSSIMPITGSLILKKQVSTDNKVLCVLGNTRGNIYYVGGSESGNYTKIQDALENASDGDTVFVYNDSSPYYENIWINNSINLIGEDKYTTQINGSGIDGQCVIVVNDHNVTICNFNIENSGAHPLMRDSGIYSKKADCNFYNNFLTYNKIGIFLGSRRNNVSNNIIVDNRKDDGTGIMPHGGGGYHNISYNLISKSRYLIWMSNTHNNIIYKNEIINSTTHSGIWAQFCNYNTIIHNNISNNCNRGIDLYQCSNNYISYNHIDDNGEDDGPAQGDDGIYIRAKSHNNIIQRNNITKHWDFGLMVTSDCKNNTIIENNIVNNNITCTGMEITGSNNIIYHNNFINNYINGKGKGYNFWNNTHPIGGNYWDDYIGVDDDGDGLGDEPYEITGDDNKDFYPLINKWGENAPYADFTYAGINLTVTLDASVSIDRDGTIILYDWMFPDGSTGTGKTIDYTFPSYDNYTVTLSVTDDDGRNHTNSKIVMVEFNYAPYTPNIPSGPTTVQVNESEMYSTSTSDPNNDMVQFRCDRDANGFHNYSEWSNFVSPGETANIPLMWDTGGIFVVKAQARDEHGFLSDWSDGLSVLVNLPPVQPFDPEPEDEAHGVDINADLSWSCSDPDGNPLTYNVYFEKNGLGVLVSENQTETFFDPGIMEYGTDYYWKIVTWDNYGGSTAGPIWCFQTMIEPNDSPYVPSNPVPEDGAVNVEVDTGLSWTGGDPDEGDTVFYDVYLEADNPDPRKVADDISDTWFDPELLEHGTMYYWKIVARDNHYASTDGPIWHFTTKVNIPPSAPSIDGPTTGKPGIDYNYTFVATDPEGDDIWYHIGWGETEIIYIYGPYPSGEEIALLYNWTDKGTYTITCWARDIYDAMSNASTLEVTIPRTRTTSYLWYQWFLERFPLLERLLSLLL